MHHTHLNDIADSICSKCLNLKQPTPLYPTTLRRYRSTVLYYDYKMLLLGYYHSLKLKFKCVVNSTVWDEILIVNNK